MKCYVRFSIEISVTQKTCGFLKNLGILGNANVLRKLLKLKMLYKKCLNYF